MPVRRYLLLLVFSLLVPAIVACGIAVLFAYSHERQRSEENLLRTTQALAESVDRELDTIIHRLQALATSPSLAQGDLQAFWQQARRAVPDEGMWVVLRGLDGQQLVNTLRPFGEPLPRMPPDHPATGFVTRAFETRGPVVSDLVIGPLVGKPTLGIVYPVFGEDGAALCNLTMTVLPAALAGLVSSVGLPQHWLAGVFDSRMVTIARSREPDTYVGRPVGPELGAAMRASAAGIIDAIPPEGIATRVAFSRSPKHGWYFAIGVPRSELAASAYQTILLFLGIALALLTAGALCAAALSRRIAGAITSLVPAAHALRRGDPLPHRETGVMEADAVSLALEETGGALAASQAERARAEAALLAAKEEAERANAGKSQFLASASHDLRQPVQSLFFFHEVLTCKLEDHPAGPVVAKMRSALDALKSLLDGLLDISRLHAGVVEVQTSAFPVASLFERLETESVARAEAMGVTLRVVRSTAWVRSDPAQLERILRNLLDNAVKYTPRGGAVLVGCRRSGENVRLLVVDTGPGIPPDKLDTVFEEFVQLGNPERDRSKGLGLGLAIVRHLGRLLGHEVAVRSRVGRGTGFSVTVPAARARRDGRKGRAARPLVPEPHMGGLALIVDDEALVLAGLRGMLESWGWDVLAAGSGVDAVRLAATSGRTPDVIIADYRLRGEETGVSVVRAIHGACAPSIPAIVLTGDTSPERIAECAGSGFRLLHKPVNAPALRTLLDAMTG
ncbi:ATP-binding protein [Azospirillum sp.]|uniref:ATP-binding protein n=1 Tax=Azospirillum sp. TaxID=34012 RepID=UPI002D4FD308|nr:ATP-binding protein [Azospirillum sp.]HYD64138.1 ATP-binding protein [Azospirillum sp.]